MRLAEVLTGILLFAVLPCAGQEVMSINAYRSIGKMTDLDTLYVSGVHTDSTQAAFGGRQEEEYMENYIAFYKGLNNYLDAHGFTWDDTTRCFNKIYFHPDGRVDKYLYGFRGTIPPEKQQRFEALATTYLKDYRFPMKSPVPFRQCGPSTFVPRPPVLPAVPGP